METIVASFDMAMLRNIDVMDYIMVSLYDLHFIAYDHSVATCYGPSSIVSQLARG